MQNAFIIHGAYGNPEENWIPWLKQKLEDRNYIVTVPQFPTPEGQSLTNWLQTFAQYKEQLTPETILIGHSIGATFILSLLENTKAPVRVSGFISDLHNPQFDSINESFYNKSFNWDKIRKNHFTLFHGDNDPYVPLEKSEALAKKLDTKITVIKNGGHLNEAAGFTSFNQLLEAIESSI